MGDRSRSPRYIQTVPKRGYRLLAPVTRGADAVLRALLVVDTADAETSEAIGGLPLEADGRRRILAGETSLEEVLRVTAVA